MRFCASEPSQTTFTEACRRTVAALTALPVGFRTGLVRRRALDPFEAISVQHHHERAVREPRVVVAG
ncbi:hypothetical protein [Streptomyces olivaceoviridis]|uniref:hypothetical protein n=1 Tax=Streptomyces olivaceoviridis TaxID=1921 RepID=UPI00368A734A